MKLQELNQNALLKLFNDVYETKNVEEKHLIRFVDILKELSERELYVLCFVYELMPVDTLNLGEDEVENYKTTAIKKLRHPARRNRIFE